MHSIYTYLATDLTTDFFIRNVLSVPDLLKTRDSCTTTQSKCEYNNLKCTATTTESEKGSSI